MGHLDRLMPIQASPCLSGISAGIDPNFSGVIRQCVKSKKSCAYSNRSDLVMNTYAQKAQSPGSLN
jgi:hypothetical protein